jgi:acyl carrier protein
LSLTREDLLQHLRDDLGLDVSRLNGTDALFSSGSLDSFSLLDLVQFLERRIGRRMEPREVTLRNLDTVDRILAYANAG